VANQGAVNQGAPAANQGARAPADEEIEGVAYDVIESDDEDDDLPVLQQDYESDSDSDDDDDEAPRYNLRRQQPPTFASYANPNGIEDVDLESESASSSSDFTINIDADTAQSNVFAQYYSPSGGIELMPLRTSKQPQEESQERTFEKGEKPRDMDEVKNMSYRFMVTQMMEHEGIAKHGEKAVEALMKEYAQLDEFKVFEPLDSASLSKKEKSRALRVINLLKEKRGGSLKGRTCVDGRLQRAYISKEESAAPTCSNNALMLVLLQAAFEGRKIATADVGAAYLHADMDNFVVIKLQGPIVDILCEMKPEYLKFVVLENGKKTLYMQLMKALYGCIKSALLWYDLFTGELREMGFELNPYDKCVANKMINGKQCTIAWWVDDNCLTHLSDIVLDGIIKRIERKFGKMTVTRGDKHTFLGMDLKFPGDGTLWINMKQHILGAIEAFNEPLTRSAATPAVRGLFNVDDESKELSEEKKERFVSVVMKLLWVAKRGRPDTELTTAFLCTRSSKCTEQDWAKSRRLLHFLQSTIDEERVLGANSLTHLYTWVDAAHAVHDDCKSHTSGAMSFGRGVFGTKSTKQKLNTKSSTEAEVVGVSDFLTSNIWTENFMKHQGNGLMENTLYQDNTSAMRMERNGRDSCGQKSRHIDIRYFWVKDRLKDEKNKLEYCPTELMLADFFTKPLQGNLFKKFRRVVMGWDPISVLQKEYLEEYSDKSKERVEK